MCRVRFRGCRRRTAARGPVVFAAAHWTVIADAGLAVAQYTAASGRLLVGFVEWAAHRAFAGRFVRLGQIRRLQVGGEAGRGRATAASATWAVRPVVRSAPVYAGVATVGVLFVLDDPVDGLERCRQGVALRPSGRRRWQVV